MNLSHIKDGATAYVTAIKGSPSLRIRLEELGFVFQQFNIFSARTAAENVEVPLLYAPGPQLVRRRLIAVDMLERVAPASMLRARAEGEAEKRAAAEASEADKAAAGVTE